MNEIKIKYKKYDIYLDKYSVMIHRKDKSKGRIEIEYYSEAELERIVEMIESIRN